MAASINSSIWNTLAELEIELNSMKASENLDELSQWLQKLRTTGDNLQSKIEELKNHHNSTIYSLPNEILALIFTSSHPHRERIEGVEIPQTGLNAMSISQVSRRWRDAAIHTFSLWTNIHLQSLPIKILELYLERSGALPLDIDINFDDSSLRIKRSLPILIYHAARWRSLRIAALMGESRPGIYQTLLSLTNLHAPQLTNIYVGIGSEHTVGETVDVFPPGRDVEMFSGGAPVLSSVQFKGLSLNDFCPPLRAVTRLEILDVRYCPELGEYIDYHHFHRWLSVPTALQDLVINPNYFSLKDAVQLPSLRSLGIHLLPNEACDSHNLEYLCTNLIAPSLRSLTLTSFTHGDMFRFGSTLFELQKYPRYPVIESLTLHDAGDIHVYLIYALPNITEIAVEPAGHKFLDILRSAASKAGSPSGDEMWPHLRTIAIRHISTYEADLLCDLVSYRAAAGHPFHCIRSLSFKNFNANKLDWLRQQVKLEFL